MSLRVLKIIEGTSVDGPGLRTSIYFAGCSHHCKGCHNPQSWDFESGEEMSVDQLMEIIQFNGFNVTFSGGDPFYQPVDELSRLAEAVKNSGLTLWAYTGFTYDELHANKRYERLLSYIDTIVDGPFIEELKDSSLLFRGSSNQRIINLR